MLDGYMCYAPAAPACPKAVALPYMLTLGLRDPQVAADIAWITPLVKAAA